MTQAFAKTATQANTLHLELWSIMCNGLMVLMKTKHTVVTLMAQGFRNSLHFWSASASQFLLLWGLVHWSENSDAGADQK